MQRLQPLDDLRRDVLKLVDQQVLERYEARRRYAISGVQALAELLERGVEGLQTLLAQHRLETAVERYQCLDELALAGCAFELGRLQAIDAQADALDESGLDVKRLVQRQCRELAGQAEGLLRRLWRGTPALGRLDRRPGQIEQPVHLLAKIRLLGIATLVGLLEQALLCRTQPCIRQRVVRLLARGSLVVQLFEPLRRAEHFARQLCHGRVEGAHALARLALVERELPERQDPQQLLAQLPTGGIGEGDHRQPSRLDAQVAEHEYHAQQQGGRLA